MKRLLRRVKLDLTLRQINERNHLTILCEQKKHQDLSHFGKVFHEQDVSKYKYEMEMEGNENVISFEQDVLFYKLKCALKIII